MDLIALPYVSVYQILGVLNRSTLYSAFNTKELKRFKAPGFFVYLKLFHLYDPLHNYVHWRIFPITSFVQTAMPLQQNTDCSWSTL